MHSSSVFMYLVYLLAVHVCIVAGKSAGCQRTRSSRLLFMSGWYESSAMAYGLIIQAHQPEMPAHACTRGIRDALWAKAYPSTKWNLLSAWKLWRPTKRHCAVHRWHASRRKDTSTDKTSAHPHRSGLDFLTFFLAFLFFFTTTTSSSSSLVAEIDSSSLLMVDAFRYIQSVVIVRGTSWGRI